MAKKNCRKLTGIFEENKAILEVFEKGKPPVNDVDETTKERKERMWKESILKSRQAAIDGMNAYNPKQDPNIRGDPYKTLFVCRLVCKLIRATKSHKPNSKRNLRNMAKLKESL